MEKIEDKKKQIEEIIERERAFFMTQQTKDISFRIKILKKLKKVILKNEKGINEALKKDLNKSNFETYMTETGMVLSELNYVIKHIKKWAKKKRVRTPIAQFHAKSYQMSEPYGVALIMAPWNYPFMLSIDPLIGAIAAGNCVVIKPSEFAPNTAYIIEKIIKECFEESYVTVIQGDKDVSQLLIDTRFDYIFYTGSTRVGKLVMESAAKNLVPVTLELGGKSPCIVEKSSNLKLAAKRIAFGKILNAGQTCVAPDYILVDKSIKQEFVEYLKETIHNFLGYEQTNNPFYPKIINEKHFNRLKNLLQDEKILTGGKIDKINQKIEITLVDNPDRNSKVMQEEIFGPILPIIEYTQLEEAITFIQEGEKPLAFYLFTENKKVEKQVLQELSFGGGCINDTIIHLATPFMGFGGVGGSGIGSYHGKESFNTFSHIRSVVRKSTWMDMPIRYMPYTSKKEKLLRFFLK